MSIHKKILIGYLCVNLALIVLGYLNIQEPNYSTATDQDLIAYGVTRSSFPIITLALTGYFWALGYMLYGLARLAVMAYRKLR